MILPLLIIGGIAFVAGQKTDISIERREKKIDYNHINRNFKLNSEIDNPKKNQIK